MTDSHPITPSPELVQQWRKSAPTARDAGATREVWIATQAARWGADQELEACCAWLQDPDLNVDTYKLRADRRPKPLSLAEEGQRILVENGSTLDGRVELDPEDVSTIRAALERLKELEQGND